MFATVAVVSTSLSWEEPILFDTTTLHHLPAMRALLPTTQPNGTRSRRRRLGSARGARTAAVCVDHTADGHFTSRGSHVAGAPDPKAAGHQNGVAAGSYIFRPPTISVCELEQLHSYCVDRINMYRAGTLAFSDGTVDSNVAAGLSPLVEWSGNHRCSSRMAMGDLLFSNNNGGGCQGGHHTSFSCPTKGGGGQNTCCARGGGAFNDATPVVTFDAVVKYLDHCLQGMWDEGIGLHPYTPGMKGHWETMRSPEHSAVSCGFAWTASGAVWLSQDFSGAVDESAAPQCSCAGKAAGDDDGCGGACAGCAEAAPPTTFAAAAAHWIGGAVDAPKTTIVHRKCTGPPSKQHAGRQHCTCPDARSLCVDRPGLELPCGVDGLNCTMCEVCPVSCAAAGSRCPQAEPTCPARVASATATAPWPQPLPQQAVQPVQPVRPRHHLGPPPPRPLARPPPPPLPVLSQLARTRRRVPLPTGGQWMPPPRSGSRQGACKTQGGNDGSYDEVWDVSEQGCMSRCEQRAECVAIEYAVFAGRREKATRCELHKEHVTHLLPLQNHACLIRPS